jgi:uncharacterized protein YceH (UPF0502 family)
MTEQTQTPSPEIKQLQRLMDALAGQRNQALNSAAMAEARAAEAEERVAELQQQVVSLKVELEAKAPKSKTKESVQ